MIIASFTVHTATRIHSATINTGSIPRWASCVTRIACAYRGPTTIGAIETIWALWACHAFSGIEPLTSTAIRVCWTHGTRFTYSGGRTSAIKAVTTVTTVFFTIFQHSTSFGRIKIVNAASLKNHPNPSLALVIDPTKFFVRSKMSTIFAISTLRCRCTFCT